MKPTGNTNDEFEDRIQAAGSGDRAAYEELFEESMPALMAYLRGKVGGELAVRESINDLAQSVCREVLTDIRKLTFNNAEQFRAYLFLQASRKVVDRYRYHRTAKRDVARQEELPKGDDAADRSDVHDRVTPSRVVSAKEELGRIESVLQQLPESQRDAVLLSRLAGLSYEEIARRKGISESAVRGLVARGLARLSVLLER